MPAIRLAAAASLLTGSTRPAAADVRDDSLDGLWLDLSAESPTVARAKLGVVATAVGPRLFPAATRLVVASGELAPDAAAAAIAAALDAGVRPGVAIGVIRGECLLERLEELALEGCGLRESPEAPRLVDQPHPPTAVWAPTGAGPIAELLTDNAAIVVARAADVGTTAVAFAAHAFAWPADEIRRYAAAAAAARLADRSEARGVWIGDDGVVSFDSPPDDADESARLPDVAYTTRVAGGRLEVASATRGGPDRQVTARLPGGAELSADFLVATDAARRAIDEQARRLAAATGVRVTLSPGDDATARVAAEADDAATLAEFATRLDAIGVPRAGESWPHRPLAEGVRHRSRRWATSAPVRLLQYGVDLRGADEWLD